MDFKMILNLNQEYTLRQKRTRKLTEKQGYDILVFADGVNI